MISMLSRRVLTLVRREWRLGLRACDEGVGCTATGVWAGVDESALHDVCGVLSTSALSGLGTRGGKPTAVGSASEAVCCASLTLSRRCGAAAGAPKSRLAGRMPDRDAEREPLREWRRLCDAEATKAMVLVGRAAGAGAAAAAPTDDGPASEMEPLREWPRPWPARDEVRE
jgi:hypothetical protein